jgi:putative DNA primase/helicase
MSTTWDNLALALAPFDLKPEGAGAWRCNSPLRPSSNSHAFKITVAPDGEHGAFKDHVTNEAGSLYELADRMGVARPKVAAQSTKRGYVDLDEYAVAHGVTKDVFLDAGWQEATVYQNRLALPFDTRTGLKYRFIDGNKPSFKPATRGYQACWYLLDRALAIAAATGQPLVICNGEPSTVVSQLYGVAATAHTSGENKDLPQQLVDQLRIAYSGQILIALDCDRTGIAGANRLYHQLLTAGFGVRALDLNGGLEFDLADFVRLHPLDAPAALQALQDLPIGPSAPVSDPVLVQANKTDAGNAECLAVLYGDALRYCHTRGKWFCWDGQRWEADVIGITNQHALDTMRARYTAAFGVLNQKESRQLSNWAIQSENNGRLQAVLRMAMSHRAFASRIEQYDQDVMLASTQTGTLDLRTNTLRPASQDDFITMQYGTGFDITADCPRWIRFLSEVFSGDQDLMSFVQRAVGYSLTGDTSAQKLFLCWGSGANGKSVFLKVLGWLLGDYAANASFETFDAGKRNEASNDLAMLRGRRLVTIIETNEDRRLDEAKVKAVTGGDLITCRFLYGEFFTYAPTFKIWLAMNHKPIIRGTDRGIWRRIVLVPFTVNFEGREDLVLEETLRAELPGILNWALTGLAAWRTGGLGTCAAVEAATESYRQESDELGKWLSEHATEDALAVWPSSDAYQDYHLWARNRGERFPMTQNSWGRSMTERRYQSERRFINGRKQVVYLGIRARQAGDP